MEGRGERGMSEWEGEALVWMAQRQRSVFLEDGADDVQQAQVRRVADPGRDLMKRRKWRHGLVVFGPGEGGAHGPVPTGIGFLAPSLVQCG